MCSHLPEKARDPLIKNLLLQGTLPSTVSRHSKARILLHWSSTYTTCAILRFLNGSSDSHFSQHPAAPAHTRRYHCKTFLARTMSEPIILPAPAESQLLQLPDDLIRSVLNRMGVRDRLQACQASETRLCLYFSSSIHQVGLCTRVLHVQALSDSEGTTSYDGCTKLKTVPLNCTPCPPFNALGLPGL